MYLNKKYQALIPRLTKALKDMKRDGTYSRLEQEILEPFNNDRK